MTVLLFLLVCTISSIILAVILAALDYYPIDDKVTTFSKLLVLGLTPAAAVFHVVCVLWDGLWWCTTRVFGNDASQRLATIAFTDNWDWAEETATAIWSVLRS